MNPILSHFGKTAKAYIASLLVAVYGAVEPSLTSGAGYTWHTLGTTAVAAVLTWVTVYGIPNAVKEIEAVLLGTTDNPVVVVMHTPLAALAPVLAPVVEQLVHVAYPAPAGAPGPVEAAAAPFVPAT